MTLRINLYTNFVVPLILGLRNVEIVDIIGGFDIIRGDKNRGETSYDR